MSSEANSYTMLVCLCARQGRRSRSCLAGVSGRREDRRPPTGLSCDGGGRRWRRRRARAWEWQRRLGLRRLQVHDSLAYPFGVGAGGSCVGCCVGEGGGRNYNTNLSLINLLALINCLGTKRNREVPHHCKRVLKKHVVEVFLEHVHYPCI